MKNIKKIVLGVVGFGLLTAADIAYHHDKPIYSLKTLEQFAKTNQSISLTEEQKEIANKKPYLPKWIYSMSL